MSMTGTMTCEKHKMEHPCCEKCGRRIGLEVHHIVPVSLGGTNDDSNLITLCAECHNNEHILNRSDLVKSAMQENRPNPKPYIFIEDFYDTLCSEFGNEEGKLPRMFDLNDIIWIMDNTTHYNNVRIPKHNFFKEDNVLFKREDAESQLRKCENNA